MYAAEYPLLSGSSENVLMRRALEDPVLRQRYASYVREAIQSASADNWLAREISFEAQQIRDSAFADTLKPYSNEDFDAAIDELTVFGQKRIPFVTKQLETIR